jgi:hypothetical protein
MASRIDQHEPAVRLDGAMHDGESEAAPAGLRGEERIEHALAQIRLDTGSGVANANGHGAGGKVGADGEFIVGERGHIHFDATSLRRRLQTVEHEVEDGAVEQVFVALDYQCIGGRSTANDDALAAIGMRARQIRRAARDSPDVDRPNDRRAHTSEIEKFSE